MENIGIVTQSIKQLLSIDTEVEKILIHEENFKKHLVKRNHSNMLRYMSDIEDFIRNPDFVGVNPREKGVSLEYVVQVEPNILIGVKLDYKNGYFYVATMHEISQLKLTQRIGNGRLRKVDKNQK